jgi:ADP-ribose pyrophosphatase YjhB (NUDIX family)
MDEIAPTGCGVIMIKDGKVLVGDRKDNGLVCGPGEHIETGETLEESAIRETREKFGINIVETIPITVISGKPAEYCPSQVFLCTEFFGMPFAFNTEMKNARFEPIGDVLKENLFLPFELSLRELLNQLYSMNQDATNVTVNGQHIEVNENGEQISGNPKVLGKGGKESEKSLKAEQKGGNIASAKGANSLEVKGFKNNQHLNNHWQNGRTHQEEYAKDGITTKEQYAQRAVELAEMPVGGSIQGYKTKEGYICRYDTSKNDYVKADIKKGIRTMFKPVDGEKYYQEMLAKEGIEDD